MLTLNVIVQTQMMLNVQVTQIRQLPWKTPKDPTNLFWPIINWSCVKLQRSWRYQKAVYSPFCINICQWESCVQSVHRVCSQSIKNNNVSTIQSVVCNCFNTTKRKKLQKKKEKEKKATNEKEKKHFFTKTMHCMTRQLQQWQNYMNWTLNCSHTYSILQICPPHVTIGCLQTSKECSSKRNLAPMKKWYQKLRHISTKKALNF